MKPILHVGDKIDVQIHHPNQPEGIKILYSQVMNVDAEYYYITPPVTKGIEYPVQSDQRAHVIFYREEGVFSFVVQFIRKVREGKLVYYQVQQVSEPQKTQRRAHYRLKYMLSGWIASLDNEKSCDMIIHDISGGGVRAVTTVAFYVKEKVECTLYLEENNPLVLAARVVRSHRLHEENRYELGIQFLDVSEQNQNRIIAFIFQKQGELRKKGLM